MSVGSFLKKAGNIVGKVGKYAAPVLAATGVGMPLALGIGAGSSALERATSGKSGGALGIAGAALKGGAMAGAGGMAGKALGTTNVLSKLLGGPGGMRPDAPGKFAAAMSGGGGGGASGVWEKIQAITGLGRPGGLDAKHLLMGGMGLIGAKQAHDAGKKGDALRDEQLELIREQIASRRPLRDAGNAGLMASLDRLGGKMLAPPDLSGLRDNMNPFRARFAGAS